MAERYKKSSGFLTFLKTKGRIWILLLGAVLGVALLLFGGLANEEEAVTEADGISAREVELLEYEVRVERELETLVESVAGVGDAEVMVTFENGYTVRYSKDASGGVATVGSGSREEAIFSTVVPPTVGGVGVVCRGGELAHVRETLTELISTALGIPSNRVYIVGK